MSRSKRNHHEVEFSAQKPRSTKKYPNNPDSVKSKKSLLKMEMSTPDVNVTPFMEEDDHKRSTRKSTVSKFKLLQSHENQLSLTKQSEEKQERKRALKGINKENIRTIKLDKELNKENVKPLSALSFQLDLEKKNKAGKDSLKKAVISAKVEQSSLESRKLRESRVLRKHNTNK